MSHVVGVVSVVLMLVLVSFPAQADLLVYPAYNGNTVSIRATSDSDYSCSFVFVVRLPNGTQFNDSCNTDVGHGIQDFTVCSRTYHDHAQVTGVHLLDRKCKEKED
jgi:hypothetical protein